MLDDTLEVALEVSQVSRPSMKWSKDTDNEISKSRGGEGSYITPFTACTALSKQAAGIMGFVCVHTNIEIYSPVNSVHTQADYPIIH